MTIAVGLLIPALFATAAHAADNKLDAVRDDVREHSSDPTPTTSTTTSSHHDHSGTNLEADLFGEVGLWVLSSPWWGPMVALDDTRFDLGWPEAKSYQPPRPETRAVAIDVLAAYQPDGDGVDHDWLYATIDTRWRFGLSGSVDRMRENDDHLTLGQTDLMWRFAQSPHVRFTTGAGVRWLTDATATDAGIDLFYGVDAWPIAPVVVRAQVAGGSVGQTGFGEAWGHVGVMWRYGEIFAGGRWLKIGSVEFAGPVFGLGAHW